MLLQHHKFVQHLYFFAIQAQDFMKAKTIFSLSFLLQVLLAEAPELGLHPLHDARGARLRRHPQRVDQPHGRRVHSGGEAELQAEEDGVQGGDEHCEDKKQDI